jgi:isochorismate hydrolase
MPVISGAEAVVQNIERLVRGFHILDTPVMVTEQYTKGLGQTVPELRDVLKTTVGYSPVEKSCFSANGSGEFLSALRLARRKQLVVAGVEAHVCVYQTVKDLAEAGYEVSIVTDAVSSRTPENRDIAIRRMAAEGAKLSSTEMALFELVGNSGTDEFRAMSKLIR